MSPQRSRAALAAAAVLLAAVAPAGASSGLVWNRKGLRHGRGTAAVPEAEHHLAYRNDTGIVALAASSTDGARTMDVSVEALFALLYVALIGTVPILLSWADSEEGMGLVTVSEIVILVIWLLGSLYIFTHAIGFQSYHWDGVRPLTIVETVYLLSQIITTVGYGDITPAYGPGQVVIGFYVLISLMIIANVVKDVSGIIVRQVHRHVLDSVSKTQQTFRDAFDTDTEPSTPGGSRYGHSDDEAPEKTPQTLREQLLDGDGTDGTALSLASKRHHKKELQLNFGEKPTLDLSSLLYSGAVFFFFVVLGVLFYHFYPGEEKTWLQAIYMSVITLSTVGFGAFNANTDAGQVFGAFWMLLGVTSLVGFVAAFTTVMAKLKEIERWAHENEEMMKNLALLEQKEIEKGDYLDRYEFISFALVQGKFATQEQLATIEKEFQRLQPDSDGYITTAFLDQVTE